MTGDVDHADGAVTKLRDAMVELTPKQFDQLSVFLLQEIGPPGPIDFVPANADSDVDLEAKVDHPLLELTYGVQNAQRPLHDTVSASDLRAFAANLQERNLHTGVLITTCDVSAPAKAAASNLNVATVDGKELAELLVGNKLGVELSDGSVALDESFWDLFRGQKRTEPIPSTEVPQADSIERLDQALKAVHSGNHEKTAIADEVSQLAGVSFDPRQTDYYGTAGWLLGFLHKGYNESRSEGRWELTRLGTTYLTYRQSGEHDTADEILHAQIRQIEIFRRILNRLREEGTMRRDEITTLVAQETELSGTTVPRRTLTIITWIEQLSSVTSSGSGASQLIQFDETAHATAGTETWRQSTLDAMAADSDKDEDKPADEASILDDIVSSFEQTSGDE